MQKDVLIIGIIAATLTLYPVLAGYQHAAETGMVFNGFDFVEDSHSYAAYIHSGVLDNPLFLKDYSTSEPQEGRYVVLYFSLIAIIVRLTGLGIDLLWNIGRIFIILFLTWAAWKLSTALFPDRKHITVGTILVLLGGGFGWVIGVLGGMIPILLRLQSTELTYYLGYTVFSFLFHPLAMISLGFLFLAAYFLLHFSTKHHHGDLLNASVFILLAFFDHPAAGVFGFLLAGFYLVYTYVQSRPVRFSLEPFLKWWPLVGAGIIALVYVAWARGDPVYAYQLAFYTGWNRHEPFWMYPFSFGLPLLFALATLFVRPAFLSNEKKGLLVGWAVIAAGMSLLFPAGVKYLYLVFPAIALLSVPSVVRFAHGLSNRLPRIAPGVALAVIVTVCCLSMPFVTQARVDDVVNGSHYYLSPSEVAGLSFLSTQGSGVVLSDPRIGSMISWMSPQRPLYAHGFLTLNFEDKGKDVARFFSRETPVDEKKAILEKYHITQIFYGPDEQKMGVISRGLPITKVYDADGVSIFRAK